MFKRACGIRTPALVMMVPDAKGLLIAMLSEALASAAKCKVYLNIAAAVDSVQFHANSKMAFLVCIRGMHCISRVFEPWIS